MSEPQKTYPCPTCKTHDLVWNADARLWACPSDSCDYSAAPAKEGQATKRVGGIFDAMLGNASAVDTATLEKEIGPLLVDGEIAEAAYKLYRDFFVFTNRRLILVDKQGLTGKKVEYLSIPYASITFFSAETAGTFDRDAELKIYISGREAPFERKFKKAGTDIVGVQRMLAKHVMRAS